MSVAGFIDDVHVGAGILGDRSALGSTLSPSEFSLVMAIGYSHLEARLSLYRDCVALGFDFPPIIHPRAHVSRRAQVGEGCMVMAGANVDAFSVIEPLCVLWPSSVVSHDCTVHTNSFISPNATLCGFVEVGNSSFIGAGSVVVNGSRVPDKGFVKAASRYFSKST
jgi:acetyltransferase-like isoleucine patch superfamily enzyme